MAVDVDPGAADHDVGVDRREVQGPPRLELLTGELVATGDAENWKPWPQAT